MPLLVVQQICCCISQRLRIGPDAGSQRWMTGHESTRVPRLVSVIPNGPVNHPTVRAFMAGGVPEVMLHLRKLGLLHEDALTVTGQTVKENLDWWEKSERRQKFRSILRERDHIDPDSVIMARLSREIKG